MTISPTAAERLIAALDVATADEAVEAVRRLSPRVSFFKIGLSLFTAAGPAAVKRIKDQNVRLFLDLKFHDIPAVVRAAAANSAAMGADMITVHAGGGRAMMEAAAVGAREAASRLRTTAPLVLGVTILTSLGPEDLGPLGLGGDTGERVARLAAEALEAGLDGVVASASEASRLRSLLGEEPVVVTPGIRPAGAENGDQRRVSTPGEALRAGADYLVVGRPILGAADPLAAADLIIGEMERSLGG